MRVFFEVEFIIITSLVLLLYYYYRCDIHS
jgi:hypothetical protein